MGGLCTFWEILSQTHLVTLLVKFMLLQNVTKNLFLQMLKLTAEETAIARGIRAIFEDNFVSSKLHFFLSSRIYVENLWIKLCPKFPAIFYRKKMVKYSFVLNQGDQIG
jgi:hypothetical protein